MSHVIDRYWAVGYPLRKRLTKSRAKLVIGVIWLASAALAAPALYASQIKPLPWLGEGKVCCDELWSDKQRRTFTLFLLCFTYIIPVCLLMFTYLRIAIVLYQRTLPDIRTHVQSTSTKKVMTSLLLPRLAVIPHATADTKQQDYCKSLSGSLPCTYPVLAESCCQKIVSKARCGVLKICPFCCLKRKLLIFTHSWHWPGMSKHEIIRNKLVAYFSQIYMASQRTKIVVPNLSQRMQLEKSSPLYLAFHSPLHRMSLPEPKPSLQLLFATEAKVHLSASGLKRRREMNTRSNMS